MTVVDQDGTPVTQQRKGVIRAGGDIEQLADAWTTLVGGAQSAAEELVRLATTGRSEFVRYSAATAVLDRTGFGKVEGLVVAAEPDTAIAEGRNVTALQVLEARMAALASRRQPDPDQAAIE